MTKTALSGDELTRYIGIRLRNPAAADRYWARCMGQDAAMDDESVARIKQFLSGKLSHEDHAKVCSMMDGGGAQDTEPPPNDVDAKPRGQLAGDAKARDDFFARFPDAARIGIDNSGIAAPLRKRSVESSPGDVASFKAMFPQLANIRTL